MDAPDRREQMGAPSLAARHALPDQLQSPAAARILLAIALDGVAEEVVQVASLLTSELVTNAVLHAHPPVMLTIEVDAKQVRVTVEDGSVTPPAVQIGRAHV